MGVNLHNLKLNYSFLGITLKARAGNERLNTFQIIKKFFKSLWDKQHHHKLKRQFAEREEVFTNHMFDKKLLSRICKELLQVNNNQ